MHRQLLPLIALTLATSLSAKEFPVADKESFHDVGKSAAPGDVIVLREGTWPDSILKIDANGTPESPITIRAKTPGKTIFTGDSRIALSGRHLHVEGLWFQNPTGQESIELRTHSRSHASHCRITNCAVTNGDENTKPKSSSRFVSIYGTDNRIDNCYFAGKTNESATMVVWLEEGKTAAHRIDHNHFGPRKRLGKNGGETIRIGDSKTSMLTASCIVEDNLFEKCDGEAECISNKSCGNVYRRNRFVEVSGTLTLRHGNDCRVENNLFLGKGARGSGGVRVIGEGHLVTRNRFEDLGGEDERSALCFMLGIPDSPANGYFQVKRATVTDNLFLNCEHNFLIGMKGDSKAKLPPIATVISGNTIQTNKGDAFEIHCGTDGIEMENNEMAKARPEEVPEIPKMEPTGPTWW